MRLSRILTLLALVMCMTGCGDLWPRDNPRDPARCDPICPPPLVCHEGICKLGDAGLPPYYLRRDAAPLSVPDQQAPDQQAPDQQAPDMPTPDS